VDESLARLQTDYLDIFLVHDIEFGHRTQIIEETIPAMRRIRDSGKARFIGITGLPVEMLHDVAAAAPVDCILSYCRYNLINTELQDRLLPYCTANGIGLINASPLHMGMLTDAGPPPWHPALPEIRATARRIVEFCRARALPEPLSLCALHSTIRALPPPSTACPRASRWSRTSALSRRPSIPVSWPNWKSWLALRGN
jgi:Predicted oxidoreductases (related to aryl-alcohol dehydrogenases)